MRTSTMLVLIAALAAACSSKMKKEETTPAPADAHAVITTAAETKVSAADVKPAATAAGLTCAKGKDSRVLAVRAKDKGCELAYTKNGQEAVVASGKSGNSHCEASREKISSKLKGSGYTCN